MFLTKDIIDPVRFLEAAAWDAGAAVLFLGTVRDQTDGRKVLHLEYEAYEEMAERILGELIVSSCSKWQLEEVRLLHRLGRVGLGEIAVAVAVWSAHRLEAYEASRFLIEAVKHAVPIWKKEFFADGTAEWSLCPHSQAGGSTAPLRRTAC